MNREVDAEPGATIPDDLFEDDRPDPFHGVVLGIIVSVSMWALICLFIWWVIR